MEKFNNINTEPNVNSNIVEQDNNPEHLKPDSLKVEKDLGKVALYRVMNLDYHPGAKKNDETGEYEYIVNNQQYPEQGDFAYNLESSPQTPESKCWSNFPPFQGSQPAEESTEQDMSLSEIVEDAPDYLSDIDPVRRKEIIDTSAEMTRDIPGAMLFGGNANRILYEAYTGKTMFGVGKNDADIYVPQSTFNELLTEQPAGYELDRELDESGKEKWIRPQDGYLVLTNLTTGDHIDTQSVDDSHKSTEVEIDGKMVKVQSLTDQINDKIKLMFETNGLADIPVDPIHNPDPISKYGVYAQYILEMADSEKGQAELAKHADELPEDWRETMEVMASQGKYGKPVDQEKRDAFQEKMEAWQKIQEQMRQIQDQMINELRAYFEANHSKGPDERFDSLPNLVSGLEDKISESLGEASSPDEFIRTLMNKMSDDEKKGIKDRIKTMAGGNNE